MTPEQKAALAKFLGYAPLAKKVAIGVAFLIVALFVIL
jgi:hypothetical protein